MESECGDKVAILDQCGSEVEQRSGRDFGEERERVEDLPFPMEEAGWSF